MSIDDIAMKGAFALAGGGISLLGVAKAYYSLSSYFDKRSEKKQTEEYARKGITSWTLDENMKRIITGVKVGKVPVDMAVRGAFDAYAQGDKLIIPNKGEFLIDQSRKEAHLHSTCCDGIKLEYPRPLSKVLGSLRFDNDFSPCC